VMLFFISDDFIRNFMAERESIMVNNTTQSFPQIFNIQTNESFQSLILSVFNYLQQGQEIPKDLIEMKFKELLFNIVLNPLNHKLTDYFKSLKETTKVNMEYIMQKHFQYDLKMDDFAKLCNMSLATFKRQFKTQFGDTPANWLKQKRLEYSTSLLSNTSLNIKEVCYESGFVNTSHYNKAFKELYHMTPAEYRLQHQ